MIPSWSDLDPGFLAPAWLAAGLAAVTAVVLLELGARRQRRAALRAFLAPHLIPALTQSVSAARRRIKRLLLVLAVGLLFLALARPHLFFHWQDTVRTGQDVLLAVDCSRSMLCEDVKPSRLARAKLAIADFAEHLPDDRLGLIAFAGDAFLQCPLTLDHDAFQNAVRELDTGIIPRPGTDLSIALQEALRALQSQPANRKVLILVTDGEDLEGGAVAAARQAAQAGVKVYTLGVGSPAGELIPQTDENGNVGYLRDSGGQLVQSRLDEGMLRQIAEITGGAYRPLGASGEGLEQLYDTYIAPQAKTRFEERREKIPHEWFEWPLALAIACLALEFVLRDRARTVPNRPAAAPPASPAVPRRHRTRRPSPAAASAALTLLALGGFLALAAGAGRAAQPDSAAAPAPGAPADPRAGNLPALRAETQRHPDRKDLQYDRGCAAYQAGQYLEAEDAFRNALDTPDLNLQEKAYYNLGNTQYRQGEGLQQSDTERTISLWEQALHAYDSALRLNPSPDSRQNYDLVQKKLEALKKQEQQRQQQQQQNGQQSQQQQQQNNPSQSNPNGNDQPHNQQNGQQGQDQPRPGDQSASQNGGNGPPQSGTNGNPQNPNGQPQGDQEREAGGKGDQDRKSARSQARAADRQDPGAKSRQEAEDLLDSLRGDEHQITARDLNRNGQYSPPPSGKDW